MREDLIIDHPISELRSFGIDIGRDEQVYLTKLHLTNVSPFYSPLGYMEEEDDEKSRTRLLNVLGYFIENKINVVINNENTNRTISLKDYTKKVYETKLLKNNDAFSTLMSDYFFAFPFEGNEQFIQTIKDAIIDATDLEEELITLKLRTHNGELCIESFSVPLTFLDKSVDLKKMLQNYLVAKNEQLNSDIESIIPDASCQLNLEENDDGFLFFDLRIFYKINRREQKPIVFNDEIKEAFIIFFNNHVLSDLKVVRQKNILFRYDHQVKDMVLDKITFMTHYNKNKDIVDLYNK